MGFVLRTKRPLLAVRMYDRLVQRSLLIGVAVAIATSTSLPGLVSAQTAGLSITPRKDYTVAPEGSATDSLRIANLSKKDNLELAVKVIDFSPQGETGAPKLELRENAAQTPWSIKPFITIEPRITLKPGETKNIPFTIRIPKDIGGGSYYGAVQYVSRSKNSDSDVAVAASGATLLFVNVAGQVRQGMTLKQLGAFEPGPNTELGSYKLFFFGKQPEVIAYTLRNDGNKVERPQGSIVIKNMFGSVVREIKDANQRDSIALIGQSRRFEACIASELIDVSTISGPVKQTVCVDPGLSPGRYTIDLSAFYGQEQSSATEVRATNTFWYLPFWFIATVLFIIAGIGVGVYYGIRYIRNRRKEAPKG